MRRLPIMSLLGAWLVIVVGATPTLAATTSTTMVELPAVIHFLTPAGDDVEVGPGIYEVEAAES